MITKPRRHLPGPKPKIVEDGWVYWTKFDTVMCYSLLAVGSCLWILYCFGVI